MRAMIIRNFCYCKNSFEIFLSGNFFFSDVFFFIFFSCVNPHTAPLPKIKNIFFFSFRWQFHLIYSWYFDWIPQISQCQTNFSKKKKHKEEDDMPWHTCLTTAKTKKKKEQTNNRFNDFQGIPLKKYNNSVLVCSSLSQHRSMADCPQNINCDFCSFIYFALVWFLC